MAQKAAKQTARRNTLVLRRTHTIAACIHAIFLSLRFLLRRNSSLKSFIMYLVLSSPSLLIQFWLDRVGRPSYVAGTGDLRRSGEDLDAKGLTEYLWDVLYWTWGCIVVAGIFGDRAWWLWVCDV
ncbi:MAG: hypothetical protein M1816_002730 [Peltula sp. TS41687]|nr:MAG: hypothetical protein M1816_002730 [Peltula sp. TS41687]